MDYEYYNAKILEAVSNYLNFNECAITREQIEQVMACGVKEEQAFRLLLASYLNLDDAELINNYLPYMVKSLDCKEFKNDPYYKNISFKHKKQGEWELKCGFYKPYELFVQDDFLYDNKRIIPNLGYFNKTFYYPAVYQKGRLWMSVTPNEINTMKEPITKARGRVLTFGLGLGYYAYMCSIKKDVESVTIVEKDHDVVNLFKKCILPQFKNKEKVKIVLLDAYVFLDNMKDGDYDYVFVDIYHDAGDGREVYLKFKEKESNFKTTKFDYWIEKTIKYYL